MTQAQHKTSSNQWLRTQQEENQSTYWLTASLQGEVMNAHKDDCPRHLQHWEWEDDNTNRAQPGSLHRQDTEAQFTLKASEATAHTLQGSVGNASHCLHTEASGQDKSNHLTCTLTTCDSLNEPFRKYTNLTH
ncbi:hypothetical protein ACOMHN_010116 [Nucella lapillus]